MLHKEYLKLKKLFTNYGIPLEIIVERDTTLYPPERQIISLAVKHEEYGELTRTNVTGWWWPTYPPAFDDLCLNCPNVFQALQKSLSQPDRKCFKTDILLTLIKQAEQGL